MSSVFESRTGKRAVRQPRFIVNSASKLKVTIPQSFGKHHPVATIGYGGFGIYCSHKEAKLLKANEIDIQVAIEGKNLKARGTIQYFKMAPANKSDLIYYVGIRIAYDIDQRQIWRDLVDIAREKGWAEARQATVELAE